MELGMQFYDMWFSASCKGHCNGTAPVGCGCDPSCRQVGDCCKDFRAKCNHQYRVGGMCSFVFFSEVMQVFPILNLKLD